MTITIDQVKAITHDLVLQGLADSVFNSAAGFRFFYEKRAKKSGGNNIGGAVIIDGQEDSNTGEWYSGASDLVGNEKEDITRAYVDWKQAQETILLSKLDIMKNSGEAQILSLVDEKVEIAKRRFKSRLAKGVFNNGSDPLAFTGLQKIIHATDDYGGLAIGDIKDEDGNNAWLPYIKTSAGTLTETLMQLTLGRATVDENRPDVALMKQNVFDEVWGLLKEHQRIMVDGGGFSGAGHDQRKTLIYNGIPHLIDSHMLAATIYYVNSNHTKLVVHSMEDMAAQHFDKLEDKNAVKERMLLTGNMFCKARNKNSSLTGITVVA